MHLGGVAPRGINAKEARFVWDGTADAQIRDRESVEGKALMVGVVHAAHVLLERLERKAEVFARADGADDRFLTTLPYDAGKEGDDLRTERRVPRAREPHVENRLRAIHQKRPLMCGVQQP